MSAGETVAAFVQSLLALAGLCVLAWLVLSFLRKQGFGAGPRVGGRIEVLERLPLDARRSVALVRIGERVFLLGIGDGGPPGLLAELGDEELPPAREAQTKTFADVLAKFKK
jgi:flagellar protein FliO/FliZ